MRRAYKSVGIEYKPIGLTIMLDDRPLRSPAGQELALFHWPWAMVVAAEAAAQGDTINPHTMPVTQTLMTIYDRVRPDPAAAQAELLSYAQHDAICYWAGKPEALREREKTCWGRILDGYAQAGMPWVTVLGLQATAQPSDSVEQFGQQLEKLDFWRLGLVLLLTNLSGSALASYWFASGKLSFDDFRRAAFLPEIYRAEEAGENPVDTPHLPQKFAELQHLTNLLKQTDPQFPVAVDAIIHGRVQGVGYRAWLQKTASARHLSGYAQNVADGTLRAQLIGPWDSVRAQLDDCLRGPPIAQPSRIRLANAVDSVADGFSVRPDL